jgi:hypothetical protein
VVKDVFQKDRPALFHSLAGGRNVKGFLNLELAAIEKRVADLLVQLEDDSILHLDFQTRNDRTMPCREMVYGGMIGLRYTWCTVIQQAVIYIGKARMNMPDGEIWARYK